MPQGCVQRNRGAEEAYAVELVSRARHSLNPFVISCPVADMPSPNCISEPELPHTPETLTIQFMARVE
jgi:hypothetical protein